MNTSWYHDGPMGGCRGYVVVVLEPLNSHSFSNLSLCLSLARYPSVCGRRSQCLYVCRRVYACGVCVGVGLVHVVHALPNDTPPLLQPHFSPPLASFASCCGSDYGASISFHTFVSETRGGEASKRSISVGRDRTDTGTHGVWLGVCVG